MRSELHQSYGLQLIAKILVRIA